MLPIYKRLYSVLTLICIAYGLPMAIIYIGKDDRVSIIHFIIAGIGFLLLIIAAIYKLIKRR